MVCPGGNSPCNGNGICDSTTGICGCISRTKGIDCSEWICPGNCSNTGKCDSSTGICDCDFGRHAQDCSSNDFFKTCPNNASLNQKHVSFQRYFVLVIVHVQTKEHAMIILVFVFAILDLKETFVKVILNICDNS